MTSAPSSSTRPAVIRATPRMAFRSVLLPAPLGPTTATTCPRDTSMSTSRTIGGPAPYPAVTPRIVSARLSARAFSPDDIGVLHLTAEPKLGHAAL